MTISAGGASQASSSSKPSRPGQMTSVMRALTVTNNGPRIPRVAVVRGGKILDERLVKDGSSVTVGSSEQAMIVVERAPAELPPSFELLQRVGDRYFLRFTDGMTGRVSHAKGIAALADLRSHAHAATDGAYRIALESDARGKVIIGDTTFLFQIVPRPPVAPRPQLPLGVKGGVGLDWSLTIIAAFSFLLHFGVAGAMYSDWMDPVIGTDYAVSGLIDIARLPKPIPETLPDPKVVDDNLTAPPTPTTPSSQASNTKKGSSNNNTRSTSNNHSVSDNDAAALAARADQMEIDLLAMKGNKSSVRDALDRSNVPAVDLSSAAARNIGATHENGDIKPHHGGPIAANKNGGLPGLAGDTKRNGQTTAGTDNGTAGPSLTIDTPPPTGIGGVISDADRVIAKLRPRFRKCYQDGLNDNPTMSGKAVIAAKIGPNGEVISTEIASNEGLSSAVTSCLARTLKNAEFTGNGSITTLRVPVNLIQNSR